MRKILCVFLMTLTVCPGLPAFKSAEATLDVVLRTLQADDWNVRSRAVDQLANTPELWRAPATKRALIELLDRETRLFRSPRPRTDNMKGIYREAYLDYYGTLLGRVDSLVDPADVGSVSVLLRSVYNPDSALALKWASYGESAVPALLEIASDPSADRRSNAFELLGQVLRQHRLGTTRFKLTPNAVRDVETRVRAGLRDPAAVVRGSAIRGVMAAGDAASLQVLERIRASDPYVSPGTTKYLIREQAEEAIVAIKTHPLTK